MPPALPSLPAVVLLVGGGAEEPGGWSDAPYAALAEGRRVAVLGTTPSEEPGWYAGYFLSLGAVAADEHVVATRAEALAADLSGYDAFFLRGGDQWSYVTAWAGTPVEDAIRAAAAVGGTSAGAAVLGELDFTAEHGTVHPEEVLADWSSPYVTLARDFLPLVPGVVADTHFGQRGRLGRLVPFAACEGAVGVGVDDKTAAVLRDGVWTVHGTATVSFVRGRDAACGEGPPRAEADMDVLVDGWTWSDADGPSGPGEARAPTPWTAPAEDLVLAAGTEGAQAILDPREDDLYCGTLALTPGTGQVPGMVTVDAWDETLVEPRVAGTVWALADAGLAVGVLTVDGGSVTALASGGFEAGGGAASVLLLAEGGVRSAEVGWQDPACAAARLARALTEVRVAIVPPGSRAFEDLGDAAPDEDTGADTDGAGPVGPGGGDTASGCGCAAPVGTRPWAAALALAAFVGLSACARRGPARV
ncbi:MAG: cyanophycinase [Myxococcota bacterium]